MEKQYTIYQKVMQGLRSIGVSKADISFIHKNFCTSSPGIYLSQPIFQSEAMNIEDDDLIDSEQIVSIHINIIVRDNVLFFTIFSARNVFKSEHRPLKICAYAIISQYEHMRFVAIQVYRAAFALQFLHFAMFTDKRSIMEVCEEKETDEEFLADALTNLFIC